MKTKKNVKEFTWDMKEEIKEYNAWMGMCEKIKNIMGITSKEFNERKDIRELIILIEKWSYWDTQLRVKLGILKEKKGVFWDGENDK